MKFGGLFLCFMIWCGHVQAQTIQERLRSTFNPWSVSGFSLISTESDQSYNGGMLNSYNFVGPNYRISGQERIDLKVAFNANTSGYDRFNGECRQEQGMELADPFFEYKNYNLGFLPGIADIFWYGRVYLPLSKSSRQKQMIGRYRSNMIVTRHFSKEFTAEFRNDVSFFHQSSSTYFGTHPEEDCSLVDNTGPSNTKAWRMDNWLSLWYRVTRNFSMGGSAILREDYYNRTSTYETNRQRFGRLHEITAFIGPSIRYTLNENLNFILSFRDRIEYSGFREDRQDDLAEFGEFRSRNTELSLLSFIRF